MAGMTGAFSSRRRADEFDALLSAPVRGRDEAAYADLLELVGALREVPPVTARSEFVADLRSQLVVEAARQARPAVDDALRRRLTPQHRHGARQGARQRRAATVLGGFAIVAASGSMAMASQAALPGDVLYPVKRAIENAQTNLQSDDAAKAQTLIAHAQRRLQEAEQLTAEGADASTVASSLQDFTEQSNQATALALDGYAATGDEEALGDLRSFTAESMNELDALGDEVPTDARAALIKAAQSVLQADTAAFQVCPTCGDEAPVTELPEFASAPMLLPTELLSFETSEFSVPVSPDFLARVERVAGEQGPITPPKSDNQGSNGDDDGTPPVDIDTTITDPDPDNVTSPLEDFGNQIKNELTRDHSHDLDPAVEAVTGAVEGIPALVDGLLGN